MTLTPGRTASHRPVDSDSADTGDANPDLARVRMADAGQPRERGPGRPCVDVAVGVLIAQEGRFLLTSRPPGKVYSGYWEFPGGKLESGETVAQALHRELLEELGISIGKVQPWRIERVDYPHALVRLHICKVFTWTGGLQMREGQLFSWEELPVRVQPILPGTVPVLQWFAAERNFKDATHLIASGAHLATTEHQNDRQHSL